MRYLISIILSIGLFMSALADNFVLRHGESARVFIPKGSGALTQRADNLLQQDYSEVFGADWVHTTNIADARIIACSMDSPDLKKYAALRNINFNALKGKTEAYILKVHNNGKQLFVVGTDDEATAFGLISLSRSWGVSPFSWLDDAPALPRESFERGVAYEQMFEPSVASRTLIVNGAHPENEKIKDLMLRLRLSRITNGVSAAPADQQGVFRWKLGPNIQPYLGLQLALQHPEQLRIEAVLAYQKGLRQEWQLELEGQLCGEFQALLFFDMAWDITPYIENEYAVDELEDLHYMQMSGVETSWSRLMNDFYDFVLTTHPDYTQSMESLRRSIGESQQMAMQLSMDLSERAVPSRYADAFFRNVEYPLNMATAQIQRLCNMQLDQHGSGNAWSAEDCRRRMELLAEKLTDITTPKWTQMMEALSFPNVIIGQSLMRKDGPRLTKLKIGSESSVLPLDTQSEIIYRSKRAVGTRVVPFEPLRLPLQYQADRLHLRFSFLPTRNFGKKTNCLVYVDQAAPQLITIDQSQLAEGQQMIDLFFDVEASVEKHEIVFRTQSDGIYLQRVWLCDIF